MQNSLEEVHKSVNHLGPLQLDLAQARRANILNMLRVVERNLLRQHCQVHQHVLLLIQRGDLLHFRLQCVYIVLWDL
jgi:hypothetical protein